MSKASLDKQPDEVAAMFDGVAGRYDLMNDILSAGQVRLWRRAVTRILNAQPGERILDVAAGTGTSTLAFARTGANAVACDFSLGMLQAGKQKYAPPPHHTPPSKTSPPDPQHTPPSTAASNASFADRLAAKGLRPFRRGDTTARSAAGGGSGGLVFIPQTYISGDALQLPFRDEAFDAVTISFGLRNVAGTGQALREMYRVTRPGGRLVVCEFSSISLKPVDVLYRRYLLDGLPRIAAKVARNPDAYIYLAESIQAWPPQPELAKTIEAAGWQAVRWRDLSLGIVAVHVGRHP
jgi:demethylmenaquinone methyltransferase / 2-methoxy-6-polyprenyl-1,4-benzoquinol methylase